jgi:hypothetical protein
MGAIAGGCSWHPSAMIASVDYRAQDLERTIEVCANTSLGIPPTNYYASPQRRT